MARLHILFTLVLLLILSVSVSAKSLMAEGDTIVDKPVSFGKRFSFHTNLVDWGLTIPNIGVEFDFSGKRTGHYSIAGHVKYRPNILQGVNPIKTHSTVNPRFVFNVLQVRGEIRKYWRTFVYDEYEELTRDTTINFFSSFISYMRYKKLSGARPYRARNWRAYYVGLYASADKFTYNFDANGRMGSGVSAGLTAGYTFPMYPMRNGASIDLDLGLSVGARMQKYTKFKYDEETHCYVNRGFQDWEVVKRPVLADAHVSLVYRFNSIDNKVRGYDERFDKLVKRWKEKQLAREDSINAKKYRREAKKDMLKQKKEELAKKKSQEQAEKKKKAANDSIEAVNKKAEKEKAKEEAKAAKEKAKEEAKAAKEKAKAEKEQAKAAKKEEQPAVKQQEAEPEAEKKEEQPEVQDEQKGGDE